ncbi:acetyl-CoA carboxylase biotin carboxyl carrier protein subunit [Variovorax sp. H27-G14]|uniref:acetyl-CoA carboxylase biotin carboxyl carrier protein n=1 Tax=Variovorax sp. H27-G14 TaxID=3111914 RepID=UPI0038FD08FD
MTLQVLELAKLLADTDIGLLELRTPQGTLRLARQGKEVIELQEEQEEQEPLPIHAPSLGVFLHAHPLSNTPLVRPGQRVEAGQQLGLLKIGPLLLPVTAPQPGIVDSIHAGDATTVGYGTLLIDLYPL